ncbi:hypothetical protein GZ998_05535 [Actinomyces sp. 594]|uniref:hypothetical protein n=1 Tax=Actinomyces sp. 594 TaxID=2057793 RepID=UPI001C55A742|nr:hypothetical protein [Actinomyces sp. 594]MBW3068975.1 hypothetical protein [Actinomyces sp. 594]
MTRTRRPSPALTALALTCLLAASACSSGSGINQSTPESLAVDVVEAARQGQDVTAYALVDHNSPEVCTPDTCGDLTALRRAQDVCADLEGELSAHVETANRDDSSSVMVYVTTPDDESGFCGFHVSKQDGKWWLSD